MIKKIKSIIDGNSLDVINLKIKRKFFLKPININLNKTEDIPIIINNRNRLFHLRKLLEFLKKKKFKNIIIIDNQSTYMPLINFYKNNNYKVIKLQKNLGYLSLWKINFFNNIKDSFYIYTDPDILPIDDCPDDFLEYFKSILIKDPKIEKVGFGLKIDDLPNNENSKKVIENENKFWLKKYNYIDNLYNAAIDTTFALYKPNTFGGYWLNSVRSDYPYLARHLSWYDNNDKNEDEFYLKNIKKNSSFYTSNRFRKY